MVFSGGYLTTLLKAQVRSPETRPQVTRNLRVGKSEVVKEIPGSVQPDKFQGPRTPFDGGLTNASEESDTSSPKGNKTKSHLICHFQE